MSERKKGRWRSSNDSKVWSIKLEKTEARRSGTKIHRYFVAVCNLAMFCLVSTCKYLRAKSSPFPPTSLMFSTFLLFTQVRKYFGMWQMANFHSHTEFAQNAKLRYVRPPAHLLCSHFGHVSFPASNQFISFISWRFPLIYFWL